MIEEEIYKRVQESIPDGLGISKQTTPIPYFGKYSEAIACTISLNPSDREFFDKNGVLLSEEKERLCSRKKIMKIDNEELDKEECEQVIMFCENYFSHNPYKKWFNKYESFLNIFGYSYYNGSVVHLDLVQWATSPFWGELKEEQKEVLLGRDLPFLKKLLSKRFNHIFLNGKTSVTEVSRHLDITLTEKREVFGGKNIILYSGMHNDSRVLGWSPYIQSANVGGYDKIRELAKLVQTL